MLYVYVGQLRRRMWSIGAQRGGKTLTLSGLLANKVCYGAKEEHCHQYLIAWPNLCVHRWHHYIKMCITLLAMVTAQKIRWLWKVDYFSSIFRLPLDNNILQQKALLIAGHKHFCVKILHYCSNLTCNNMECSTSKSLTMCIIWLPASSWALF